MRSDFKTSQRARELRQRMTSAELVLWSRIRPRAWPLFRFRRQHPIGPYIADFACPLSRVIVEVDGATHSSDEERAYDRRRDMFMRACGWRIIRVTNEDVYKRLYDVVDYIARLTPPPPLRSRNARSAPPP
jgi:very-short-patch-repair endonuclease